VQGTANPVGGSDGGGGEKVVVRVCAVLAAALLLAACGSSSHHASTAVSQLRPVTNPPAATTPTTTAPTATTTTATTALAAGPRPCVAADLELSSLGQQGGMGRGEIGFALRNISAVSCHTYGYPGILFLGRSGEALPTVPTRTTHDFFGSTPPTAIVLAPGERISFRLGVTHGIASSAGCTTAYGLQVIPPDDTATLRTSIPDGAYECRTATVSPLRPGDSAYP
jgi:uncharacterized protein DUF4232